LARRLEDAVYGGEKGFPWSFFLLIAAAMLEFVQVAFKEWGHSLWLATFVNGGAAELASAGPARYVGRLEVEPPGPIAPGETRQLALKSRAAFSTKSG
jgi:hypothetical protein